MSRVTMRIISVAAVIGLSAGLAPARPQPPQPSPVPPGPATSTTDELTDMVLDVIEQDGPSAPTTTPVPIEQP